MQAWNPGGNSGDICEPMSRFSRYILHHVALHSEDSCSSKQVLWDNLACALGTEKNSLSPERLQDECRRLETYNLQAYAVARLAEKTFKLCRSNSIMKPASSLKEVKLKKENKCNTDHSDGDDQEQSENSKPRHENVMICVLDDARKSEETFVCPRSLLLREMPYFEKFLESETEDVEVQFSVHCDIQVFKRLLLYASKEDKSTFLIEPKYAIHMLVSAEFLEMEPLVEECLKYCFENIELLISMSGIIGLLSEDLLERLSNFFSNQDISSINDPTDKIKSKLFRKKSEKLLNCKSPRLLRCSLCQKVFSQEMDEYELCLPNRTSIGQYGNIKIEHKIDPTWDRSAYLQSLEEELGSWASVYWQLWGSLHCLPCIQCNQPFPCSKFFCCKFHPEPAQFLEGDAAGQPANTHLPGKFLCCHRKVFRFNILDPLHMRDGCAYRMHVVPESAKQTETYKTLKLYKDLICSTDDDSLLPPTPQHLPFESLCTWPQDKISKPSYKNSSGTQKTPLEISRERCRLLPGRGESLSGMIPQSDSRLPLECPVWNSSSSVWHNQDAVREYDYKAMDAIIAQLKQL